jgi:sortase B
MEKNKKISVKNYEFKNKDIKTKHKIDGRTKGNKIVITIVSLLLVLVWIFIPKPQKFIEAVTKIEEISVVENKTQEDVSNDIDLKCVNTKPEYVKKTISQNPNIIGRISIEGTEINYPVVQTDNNEYYLSHNYNYEEDKNGSIFMDYRCDIDDFSKTKNMIIYGHRMKDGSMFKGLLDYEDQEFFLENRIIQFDSINSEYRWKVFSVFETTTDFYYIDTEFPYDEMWLNFLEECIQLSIHKTNTSFYKDDIVLTLSTCTMDQNGRFVVMAKLIE